MSELDEYDYELPPERIAQDPAEPRDAARLLVLDRSIDDSRGPLLDRTMRDLPMLLAPGDLLVFNDSRVVPARLAGVRAQTGGRWSGLFLASDASGWKLIGQTRGTLAPGEEIHVRPPGVGPADGGMPPLRLRLVERDVAPRELSNGDDADPAGWGGVWRAVPLDGVAWHPPWALLEQYGTVPLPPYIERDHPTELDKARYQTIYAARPGSVAAPTAGLHFTPRLLDALSQRGIATAFVTLHVGLGTFRPVTASRLDEHRMHSEWCEVPETVVRAIEAARARGGRAVAVGTTTVRALESAALGGVLKPWTGPSALFIRPGHAFRAVDALLTNFHLPRSTLLVLLCALAGRDRVLAAYAHAVREGYRFYSYGDAMLVL